MGGKVYVLPAEAAQFTAAHTGEDGHLKQCAQPVLSGGVQDDRSTYYWKHVYQRNTEGLYLPNGAFALAATLAGLPMDWSAYNPTIHARESRHNPIGALVTNPRRFKDTAASVPEFSALMNA